MLRSESFHLQTKHLFEHPLSFGLGLELSCRNRNAEHDRGFDVDNTYEDRKFGWDRLVNMPSRPWGFIHGYT